MGRRPNPVAADESLRTVTREAERFRGSLRPAYIFYVDRVRDLAGEEQLLAVLTRWPQDEEFFTKAPSGGSSARHSWCSRSASTQSRYCS